MHRPATFRSSRTAPAIAVRLLAVVLAALSLGLSFAHVLEMPPRLRWTPEL